MGVQKTLTTSLASPGATSIIDKCARVAAKLIQIAHSLQRSYIGRYLFKRNVANAVSNGSELKLVIGASGQHEKGWIGTEIEYLNLLKPQDWHAIFQPNQIDALMAEHVWEHLTLDDGLAAARQCYEFLKAGSYIRVAVPDGYCRDPEYMEWVRPGGSGVAADDHKVLYNHKTLTTIFKEAGFRIELLEYFDEHGVFHHTDWDPADGKIIRSRRYDERNANGELVYTSLIIDAKKIG